MNITFISTYPPTRCGIGTYTSYLCRALLRIEKAVKVSVIADKGASQTESKRFDSLPCFDRKEEYVKKITETLSKCSSDIVHIEHEFAVFKPDKRFLNLVAELRKKTKIVLTLHTVHTNETNDWDMEDMSMEHYNCRIGQLVDAIIVHHDSMKQALVRQGVNEKRIHVIPHGTKLLRIVDKTEAKRKLELPENGIIILSFGFFGKQKAKELIVEALAYLLKEVPNAYVFFSGYIRDWVREDFESRNLYEERAKELGVRDHVIFAKQFIPDKELHLIFGSSDAVVFPYFQRYLSASGGFHLAVGSFKPVVVSRTPQFEEVPREISGDLVFSPNDSVGLAKILVRLTTDNGFRKSIIEKVTSYALRTSWDVVAGRHMQVYNSLQRFRPAYVKTGYNERPSSAPVPGRP